MSKKGEGLKPDDKKVLSSEEQREQDLMPFQSISRTTSLLHFFWNRLMSFVLFFGYIAILSYISHWLFGWGVLSPNLILILAAIGSAMFFLLQELRKKYRNPNS